MSSKSVDVLICGAGIAGISTAYHLAVERGIRDVLLVDERPPLSLTSDKSTECYRNWWPGPGDAMVSMMNRSIDILERLAGESGNIFQLNRRGYLFATAEPARLETFRAHGEEAADLGAGPLRIHDGKSGGPAYQPASLEGYHHQPIGADLITDPALIREHFPYLSEATVGVIHARRAGWFGAQQLGMYMLERARAAGVRLRTGRVTGLDLRGDRIQGARIQDNGTEEVIATRQVVNAAGPFVDELAGMAGLKLPVFSELHTKLSIQDHLGLFPREAPLLIWADPQRLPWKPEEIQLLAEDPETHFLLETFPEGIHARAEGPLDSNVVLILWTYHTDPVQPTFPIPQDPFYPEIALRGMAALVPAFEAYFERPPRPFVDGGYYTKTQENRPLVGPLPVEGFWIIGALSGFGLMAGPACGELLSLHIAGEALPSYSDRFLLSRYQDPQYRRLLETWDRTGQL